MLDKVTVKNDRGVNRAISFNSDASGLVVQDISGLGPVSATLNRSRTATGHGEHLSSKSIGSRNIVFQFELRATDTTSVAALRHGMYATFPIGEEVELEFDADDDDPRVITGTVESVEPVIFTKDPSVQVSIICTYPFFKKWTASGTNTAVLYPNATSSYMSYAGTVETGVDFIAFLTVAPDSTAPMMGMEFFIQDSDTLEESSIYIDGFNLSRIVGSDFQLNDEIILSSVPGRKKAVLNRAGVTYNILGAVTNTDGNPLREDQWPRVYPGKYGYFGYRTTNYDRYDVEAWVQWDELTEGL